MEKLKKTAPLAQGRQITLDLGPQSTDLKLMREIDKVIERMRKAAYTLRGTATLTANFAYMNAATLKAVAERYGLEIRQNGGWERSVGWQCVYRCNAQKRDVAVYFSTEKIGLELEVSAGGLVWKATM